MEEVRGGKVYFGLEQPASYLQFTQGSANFLGNRLIRYQAENSSSTSSFMSGFAFVTPTNNTVMFPGESRLALSEEDEWEPGYYGAPGVEPACFGFYFGFLGGGSLQVFGKLAMRNWVLDATTSAALNSTNGYFSARPVSFPFVLGAGSIVDYHITIITTITDPDSVSAGTFGKLPNALASQNIQILTGRHELVGCVLTQRVNMTASMLDEYPERDLDIPIGARLNFTMTNGAYTIPIELYFTGLVAAVEAPDLLVEIPDTEPAIVVPPGFQLQWSSDLSVDSWVTYTNDPPVTPDWSAPVGFFRATR